MFVNSRWTAESMSRYLIRRIEENPAITPHVHTEIVGLEGSDRLEARARRDNTTGRMKRGNIGHVFA